MPVEGQSKPRKQPHYVTRKDGQFFTFAGLWERWKDGMLSFTILTTEGFATMRKSPCVWTCRGRLGIGRRSCSQNC